MLTPLQVTRAEPALASLQASGADLVTGDRRLASVTALHVASAHLVTGEQR